VRAGSAAARTLVSACALAALAACGRTPDPAVLRAAGHIERLATTIGSRPIGTPANDEARAYIASTLTDMGVVVTLAAHEAADPARGLRASAVNIVGVREGTRPDAIALVTHYDSVPDGPGAGDDALGVGIVLEAARALAAERLDHTLVVVVTDGEEVGLMGARAFAATPLAGRVRAFLNFDGTGAAGPALMFETTAYGTSLVDAWLSGPRPVGGSFTVEIYRRLPNDTDFTALKHPGVAGLNFGAVEGAYGYHTDRDRSDRVSRDTIGHGIQTFVDIVRRIDRDGVTLRAEPAVYFDIFSLLGVSYGAGTSAVLTRSACVAAAAGWLLLTIAGARQGGVRRLAATAAWSLLSFAFALAAMIGAVASARALSDVLVPWYASPQWMLTGVAASGAAALATVGAVTRRVPAAFRPWADARATWWASLPVWTAAAAWLQGEAPVAAYLVGLPLAAAALGVIVAHRSDAAMRRSSWAVAAIVAVFWSRDVVRLVKFMVPELALFAIVQPVWLYPVFFAAAGLMWVPPLVAIGGRRGAASPWTRRFGIGATVVAIGALGTGLVLPAYTADRPERRAARFVQDERLGRAWWEIGGAEPGVRLESPAAPPGLVESLTPVPASLPLPRLATFAARADTALRVPVPAAIAAAVRDDGKDLVLEVTVRPDMPLSAELVMPTLRRRTAYVAPPQEGGTLRVRLGPTERAALEDAFVVLTRPGLPGGTGPQALPPWLPLAAAAWRARTVVVVPVDLSSVNQSLLGYAVGSQGRGPR
jgi:hypothetical protein